MNKKYRKISSLVVAGLAFLFAACSNSLTFKPKEKENEKKLVEIHPVVQMQNRSALPQFDEITVEDFTDVVFSFKGVVNTSERKYEYDSISELQADTIRVYEDTYTFNLSAVYNSVTFIGTTTKEIVADEDNVISFVMHPDEAAVPSDADDPTGEMEIVVYFPADSNPVLNSGRIYVKNTNGSIKTEIAVTESDYSCVPAADGSKKFTLSKSLPAITEWYNIELSFISENADGSVGFYKHYTSAMVKANTTSYENGCDKEGNAVIRNFFKGYKITWHVDDVLSDPEDETSEIDHTNDFVTYYATTYGYDLYLSELYSWETSEGDAVTAKAPGTDKGNKDFYVSQVSSDYGVILIYDIAEPAKVLKRMPIRKRTNYYNNKDYSISTAYNNEKYFYGNKEGYYVSGVYTDAEGKNSLSVSSSGNNFSSSDSVKKIYIKYKPEKTFTLVSLTDGRKILDAVELRDTYKLSEYKVELSGYNYQVTYNIPERLLNFYTQVCDPKDSASEAYRLSRGSNISATGDEDVTVYVDDYLEPVFTVNFINKNTDELLETYTEKYSFKFTNSQLCTSTAGTVSYGSKYILGGYVKDSEDNYIALALDTYYDLDPVMNSVDEAVLAAIDEDKVINVYIDIVGLKTVTLDYSYNVPYKLAITDIENNSQLINIAGNYFVDTNNEYLWLFYTSNSSTSSTMTFSYIPIDKNEDFTFEKEFIEVEPVNAEPLDADRRNYSGNYDYYTLVDSEVPFAVYTYNFEEGNTYYLNYSSSSSGSFTGSTYAYWYLISPSKKYINNAYSSGFNYAAEETGEYKLIFRPRYQDQNSIKVRYQIYSLNKSQTNITVNLINSDINTTSQPVTKTETAATITLTAPDGYDTYEWLLGDYPLGSGKTLTLTKADYIGLVEGTDPYYITLKVKEARDDAYYYTATFQLKAESEEE